MIGFRCTSFLSGALYRVVYDDSYADRYVVLRAVKTYGEKKYDIFEQNCEHSTRWCKTGLHESMQMEACFTTAAKAALVIFLRLISLIVLWLLQLPQPRDGGSRKPERVVSVVYMAAIGVLFLVYSLYNGCKAIRPKVPSKRHDIDICGIESARRRCADGTYTYCCCAVRKCGGVVLALGCASCFFCSLFDACCSVCRKNIQCGTRTICRRAPAVVVGLFLRMLVRETIAAAGPLLVVYYEHEIASHFATVLDKFLIIILAIVGASLGAYLVGALIGVWIEALFVCCANCCCGRSTHECDGERRREQAQPVREEVVLLTKPND